jgi:hypothetical protein
VVALRTTSVLIGASPHQFWVTNHQSLILITDTDTDY